MVCNNTLGRRNFKTRACHCLRFSMREETEEGRISGPWRGEKGGIGISIRVDYVSSETVMDTHQRSMGPRTTTKPGADWKLARLVVVFVLGKSCWPRASIGTGLPCGSPLYQVKQKNISDINLIDTDTTDGSFFDLERNKKKVQKQREEIYLSSFVQPFLPLSCHTPEYVDSQSLLITLDVSE